MKQIKTEFAPETRFAVPVAANPKEQDDFQWLQADLLRCALQQVAEPTLFAPLQRAASEAARLAAATSYPLLLFPLLFEEKALAAVEAAGEGPATAREPPGRENV